MTEGGRPTQFADAYVFDLDGTIFLGGQLLPGAARMVGELRRRRIPVRFLSNNPTRDAAQYSEKLARLGLPTPASEITNPIATTVGWLRRHHPDAVVFPIAEGPLWRALAQAGIAVSEDPERIDIVIASYDRGFDYRKLQIAFDAIWFHRRAFLVQTHPDRFCPYPSGHGEPDAAAITAAIEACTSTTCQATLGKPNPLMLATTLAGVEVPLERAVMVGDRPATDIAMAQAAGMPSALVLTGEASAADAAALDPAPTWVLDRIDKLAPEWAWAQLGWSELG